MHPLFRASFASMPANGMRNHGEILHKSRLERARVCVVNIVMSRVSRVSRVIMSFSAQRDPGAL